MSIIEKIEILKETIEEQESIIKEETERIACLRKRCANSAELICRLNSQAQTDFSQEKTSGTASTKSAPGQSTEMPADSRIQKMASDLLALKEDGTIWPHIDCRMQVNLRDRLWEVQVELKGLENKMLDGSRAQLRKWAIQLEEMRQLRDRLDQALLAVESWEGLFFMFMDDMDIRRHSGMDERFYQMERKDIKQKMQTCKEFYEEIEKTVETALLRRSQEVLTSAEGSQALSGCGVLTEEIQVEILRYAIGILFFEEHLYRRKQAEEKKESAAHMLKRLEKEHEMEKRWIAHMQFA